METYKARLRPIENDNEEVEQKTTPIQRKDRLLTQLRPVCFQVGVVSQAFGSAYVEVENTKVICSVWPPRSNVQSRYSDSGRLWCDFKYAPFAQAQRRTRGQNPDERQLSLDLVNAIAVSIQLDKFPKSVLEVYVVVLEDGGNVLSTAISGVSLALASAGVEMYDIVAACNVAKIGNQLYIDPSHTELARAEGTMLLGFMPSLQQITYVTQTGSLTAQDTAQMVDLGLDGCAKVQLLMKQILTATAKRQFTLNTEHDQATNVKRLRVNDSV